MRQPDIVRPEDIEARSMQLIEQELGPRDWDAATAAVVRRVIHTTADFDFAETLAFVDGAVPRGLEALRAGAHIVCDTRMVQAGINRAALERLGGALHCFMADADVAAEAKSRGVTRAVVSMERATQLPGPLIFAIGNAPTALFRLRDLCDEGAVRPALVIGVPVGFVNVVESKELFLPGANSGVPAIVARGRKGGSTVAVAICNALLYLCGGRA